MTEIVATEITQAAAFDVARYRADFPILSRKVYDRPLVYLDNAASSQKPRIVIDRIKKYYEEEHSNVHRGVHFLSQEATNLFEGSRRRIARFINAPDPACLVFTRGTTEAINLVASAFGRRALTAGDEIILTHLEHHSNIVPWQLLCQEMGANLRVVRVTESGEIDYDHFLSLLSRRTRILAVAHISNALGTVNPVAQMIDDAHRTGAVVLIDGAQAVPHMRVDVQSLDCDFYCFSGHKMFGPTGIGVLYGRRSLLEDMPPYQGGGDMIERVSFEGTTYNEIPHKFEAGTPDVAGAVGLEAAVEYLEEIGMERIAAYEHDLLAYATERLLSVGDVQVVGSAVEKASVISFMVEGVHPYDAGTILDRLGIAVRTGHHCTQPLMARFGIPGTVRASFAFYNTFGDADALVDGVKQVKKLFA